MGPGFFLPVKIFVSFEYGPAQNQKQATGYPALLLPSPPNPSAVAIPSTAPDRRPPARVPSPASPSSSLQELRSLALTSLQEKSSSCATAGTAPPGHLALEGGAAVAGTRFPDAAPALCLPRRLDQATREGEPLKFQQCLPIVAR